MPASCDLFVRSYYKDFPWLAHCLRSIETYCRGFRRVVLVVPEASRERLDRMNLRCDQVLTCRNYPDDYLGQQVTKLMADTLTDADYICHIDSDCLFCRPVTPAELFEGAKPRVFIIPYDELPATLPWRRLTRKFLGHDVVFEFMRRQPQTFPRWLYGALRAYTQALHGIDLETYVTSQPPRGFSEFNALGAYAYHHHREEFAWLDLSRQAAPAPLCRCYWSWGGLAPAIVDEIQGILGPGAGDPAT